MERAVSECIPGKVSRDVLRKMLEGLALDVWVMSGHMDMQIAAPTEYASEAETHES